MYLTDVYTLPASLAGIPAASIPVGLTSGGLPVGLQIMAPPLAETRLFAFAAACEKSFPPSAPPGLG